MRIVSANITGSLILNGVDVTDSFVSSSVDSGSFTQKIDSLQSSTSSLNSFTSSINTTIKNKLDSETVISGSIQVNITGTTGYSTFSSSVATTTVGTKNRVDSIEAKTGSYATTGSNTFIGTENITGNLTVTGSVIISSGSAVYNSSLNLTDTSSLTLNSGSNLYVYDSGIISGTFKGSVTGSLGINGNVSITGSIVASGTSLVSGSSQIDVTSTTNYTTFSSSVSSSIGNLSSSVATTTSNLSSSVGSLSSSVATTTSDLSSSIGSLSSSVATNTSGLAGRITTIEGNYATTGSNVFVGSQVITGSLYITTDLIVQGSSSLQNITASAVSIGTNTVILNTDTPAVRFAGISVQDSGSNAGVTGSIFWDGLCNRWVYSNPSGIGYSGGMLLSGPRTSTLGTESPLTCNYIAKSGGGDHLYDSCIIDDGTTVCVNANLKGSGQVCGLMGTFSCVGIGTPTPSTKLQVVGSIKITDNPEVDYIGFGAGNTSAKYSYITSTSEGAQKVGLAIYTTCDAGTTNQERVRITDLGNVGIGTLSPSYKFEVCGPGETINIIGASSGDVATGFRIGRGASLGAQIYDNPQDNITTINTTGGLNLRTGGSGRLSISSTGISCFSCQVCAPVAIFSGCAVIGNTVASNVGLTIYGTNSATIYQTPTSGTGAGNGLYVGQVSDVSYVWNYNCFPLVLATGNAERMRITSTGIACFACQVCTPHLIGLNNISIGSSCTTSDGYNTRLRITNIANDTFVFSFNNQACRAIMYMYGGNTNNPQGYTAWADNTSGNTNHLISHNTGQATYFATQGGCVGIGTSSPSAALQIRRDAIGVADVLTLQNEYTTPGVTAGQGIGIKFIGSGGERDWGAIRMTSCDTSSDNYFMSFHVRDAANAIQQRMIITSGGNVGIATNSPVSPLHVVCVPSSFFGIIETTGCSVGTVKHFRIHKPGCVEYGIGILDNNAYHISTASTFPTANGFTLTSNGNVGFGECNPGTEKMVILGGSGHNNVFLRLKTDGTHGTKPQIHFDSGLVGINRATKAMIMAGYNSPTGGSGGVMEFYTNDTSENLQQRMCIDPSGQVTIMGALAKGSGSFRICHPLSSKANTHTLVHSFIEGPNADLIYSGHIKLTNGVACINIDCSARMTQGTFEALNRCVRIFTTNETSWDAVRGKVCGNMVVIESQNNSSEDEISWMVIGERQDQHMFDTEWTDTEGRVITEPEIVIVNDDDIV